MPFAPSVNFVLQRALRKIGAYPITSSGPRAPEMEEAAYWFDMQVAHLAARKRTWWLVAETAVMPLVAGQREYALADVLAPDATEDGLQAVIAVWIDDATTGAGLEQVNILRREEYEAEVGAAVNASGVPTACHIDRAQRPTLRFVQAPDAAGSYRARIVYQTYAPELRRERDIAKLDRFRTTWTLYLVSALAAQLADGPIRKAPRDEVQDMKRDAAALLHDLESYDDHEQHDEPTVVQFHNGI
jgi:hypothetical protein